MSARQDEAAMLARCLAAAHGAIEIARDQQEANVFRVASMVVQSRFRQEAAELMQASARYFALHAEHQLPAEMVVRNGWVVSLPRLRDMLCRQLQGKM